MMIILVQGVHGNYPLDSWIMTQVQSLTTSPEQRYNHGHICTRSMSVTEACFHYNDSVCQTNTVGLHLTYTCVAIV